ncbi:MAG: hypothetical protein M0007_09655 [Actinomycetota bacterium]|jgi:hypothetical protein|nr:hypothetical protein [Actinomycetota bacterium]
MSPAIDSVAFFDALAAEMNASGERFRAIGDADMTAVVVMRRAGGDFRVRLVFDGLTCAGVAQVDEREAALGDFSLVGDLAEWQGMFGDIAANGRATGLWTINSLALLGDRIACEGTDQMGLDKFSRFNQTLQEFFDGAARIAVAA